MKEKLFLYNPEHAKHQGYIDEQEKSWDTPERVFRIVEELLLEDGNSKNMQVVTELHPETLVATTNVHNPEMVRAIGLAAKTASETGPTTTNYDLDAEENTSLIYPDTLEEALMSVECALIGLDNLLSGETKLAIALNRPPGHHAGQDFYHGFCYLNNAAIAANEISQLGKKCAIIDFDIHHGDGTEDIVKGRNDIMYNSLHADPEIVMPHTGYASDHDEFPNINNFPLPIGISAEDYLTTFTKMLGDVSSYQPDYLIIDAGFDGHRDEYPDLPPLTLLEDEDYQKMGQMINELDIPTLVLLSGGYNQEVTPSAFSAFIKGLSSEDDTISEIITSDKII